jgi:Erythromycin esterase
VAASLQGRTAAGLLRYQAAMADTSPSRVARLMRLRDAMMTENLTDIATREADRGPTLVFAHTPAPADEPELLAAGGHAPDLVERGRHRGRPPRPQVRLTGHGVRCSTAAGPRCPAPDTLEGALSALPSSRYVFTTDRLAAAIGEVTPRTDHGPEHGYSRWRPTISMGWTGCCSCARCSQV